MSKRFIGPSLLFFIILSQKQEWHQSQKIKIPFDPRVTGTGKEKKFKEYF
jgi:hypothetical protein